MRTLTIAAIGCAFALAGCSGTSSFSMSDITFSTPAPIDYVVETEPPGAEVRTSLGQSCQSPCTLSIASAKPFSVDVNKQGFRPQIVTVEPRRDGLEQPPLNLQLEPLVAEKKKPRKKERGGKPKQT